MIACWPGEIEANTTNDQVSAFWDMMPTFAQAAKIESPQTSGISIFSALLGRSE